MRPQPSQFVARLRDTESRDKVRTLNAPSRVGPISFFSDAHGDSSADIKYEGLLARQDALRCVLLERIEVAQAATKVRGMVFRSKGEIDVRRALVSVFNEHASDSMANPWTAGRIGL
jgi:hypothetical protein